ncbi:uncharacterized protein LOC119676295 [Teleopsis dalmanni]|uniref:uncharacterized protein LOC119676295 n=1 Tax=Teleopsis dalmanni TaxID=139649 RepID=UPI0018CF3624|nr:uncharacterized protein LOC119676295 [Teleopsis dalmanni]
MVVPLYSSECCPIVDEITTDVRCLMKGLCCELTKLENKHKKAFTKRLRLHELAIPPLRKRAERFVRTCACKFPKPIELIRMDKAERTRTTQLALPQVRKLLLSQKALNKLWENPFRNYILNRLIRSSLFSLYSRLANVQPPKEPVKIHKWDKDEWKVHRKYLKKLARHKVPPPVPKIIRKRMPLSAMFRYKKLYELQ